MKKLLTVLGIASILIGCSRETKEDDTSSKEKEEWKLVWQDDFNRDDIFATGIWSKIWGCPTSTADWCKLQTDYIDLLLIRQPFGDYYGSYRAMEEAYKEGKVRAIGVSNFYADRYLDLACHCEIKPAVNQMETHMFYQQQDLQELMKKYDTKLMSWGPFAEGKNDFFANPTLNAIGEKVSQKCSPSSFALSLATRYYLHS